MRAAAIATGDLAEIVSSLRGLRPSPNAEVSYELFSDGLWWSDELPGDLYGFERIRTPLHLRTKRILGQHLDEFDVEYWDEARRLIPEWPGFDPRRSSPDYQSLYESLSADALRAFDELRRELGDDLEASEPHLDEVRRFFGLPSEEGDGREG